MINSSRFTVGQKIVAISYVLNGRYALFSNPVYKPWSDKLNSIELVILTVDSKHDVPSCWDPNGDKEYTGFLLRDNAGQIWANQYPHASYGQISDAEDWMFHRQLSDPSQATDEQLCVYEDTARVLERIQRGINHFSKPGENFNQPIVDQLKGHLKELEALIHQRTDGVVVQYKPIYIDHHDITEATLIWPT